MSERLFSCVAGSKSITINASKLKITGPIDFLEPSRDYIELTIQSNTTNHKIKLKFQQESYSRVRFILYEYDNKEIQNILFNTGGETLYLTLTLESNRLSIQITNPLANDPNYGFNVSPNYDREFNLEKPIYGNIVITLYRSATDESYCSDFTIEYTVYIPPIQKVATNINELIKKILPLILMVIVLNIVMVILPNVLRKN